MNRHTTLTLTALAFLCLGIALPPSDALGQQKSLKELIVGTWLLNSVYDQTQDGEKHNAWGDGVKGQATSDGNLSWQMMSANRPKADTSPREPVGQVVAFWGTTRSTMRQRLIPSTLNVVRSRNGMGSTAPITLCSPQRTNWISLLQSLSQIQKWAPSSLILIGSEQAARSNK